MCLPALTTRPHSNTLTTYLYQLAAGGRNERVIRYERSDSYATQEEGGCKQHLQRPCTAIALQCLPPSGLCSLGPGYLAGRGTYVIDQCCRCVAVAYFLDHQDTNEVRALPHEWTQATQCLHGV